MRVLLIQADLSGGRAPIFPMGLAYVAAALTEHDVRIFDPNVAADGTAELKELLNGFSPEVVGISLRNVRLYLEERNSFVLYHEQMRPIVRAIRDSAPDVKIIIGGAAFSLFGEEIMRREPEVDIGVFLDGEESMPELLDHLDTPEEVKGLFIRKGDEVIFTGSRGIPDFRKLPHPRRDLVDISRYSGGVDSIGVQTKRGCRLGCAYCVYPFLSRNSLALRSPRDVVDEVEELAGEYGLKTFMFIDSVFNLPRSHAEEICAELIRRKLPVKWTAYFNEKNVTEEFMLLCRDAGCFEFFFSPDSYSDRTLRMFRKNIRKEDILKTYRIAKKHKGIRVRYNFMINVPGESLGTLLQLAGFIFRARVFLRGRLGGIGIGRPRIEPHTPLYDIALKEGLITEHTDLIPPVFYSYPPADYINKYLKFMLTCRNACKRLLPGEASSAG